MASSFFLGLGSFFARLFGSLGSFMKPLALSIAAAGGTLLVAAAQSAVSQVAADPSLLSDSAKRDKAFQLIQQQLVAQGIPVVANAINGAIEAAVAAHKSQ